MQFRKWSILLVTPLILAACEAQVPSKYTDPKAGFSEVSAQTSAAIGKRTAFAQTKADNVALQKQVHAMVYRKTISADTAVQAALLNNKESKKQRSIHVFTEPRRLFANVLKARWHENRIFDNS